MATGTVAHASDAQQRAQATAFRRGLTLLLMTLVLPWSGQLAAGNRRIGVAALRVWGVVVAAVAVVALLVVVNRSVVTTVLTTGPALWLLSIVVAVVGVGWALLVAAAWFTARPAAMGPVRAVVLGVLSLGLALVLSVTSINVSAAMRSSARAVGNIFGGGGDTSEQDGRYNFLLLGADAGSDREGLRPDSITVASVDARTGRTALFSLPRNLEEVPFPTDSPLHELYPNGYDCPSHECLLNAVYTLGEENKDLYPGVKYPGLQATKEAVEASLGLTINYLAMVDMTGFVQLVDAVGGVRMDVNQRVPMAGGAQGYIEVGPNQLLDGNQALWFARSRTGTSDYDRMARQKCVMSAMLHQLDPMTVATKFTAIADASGQILITDVPSSEVDKLASLAMKARQLEITSVSFTPPLIHTGTPDYKLIHETVAATIAASEALDAAGPTSSAPTTAASAPTSAAPSNGKPSTGKPSTGKPSTGKPTGSARSASKTATSATPSASEQPNVTEDLTAVCAAR